MRPVIRRAAWRMLLGLSLALQAKSAPIGEVRFSMVDQDGKAVTESVLAGQPSLVYFGFTSCPDICPTDLAKMKIVAEGVRKKYRVPLRPVFVTVDPERDRPANIKAYVRAFAPDFVGLTGSPAQTAEITRQFHVYYKKVPFGDKGNYTMDHSTFLFLLDAKGRYLAHYGRKVESPQLVEAIGTILARR